MAAELSSTATACSPNENNSKFPKSISDFRIIECRVFHYNCFASAIASFLNIEHTIISLLLLLTNFDVTATG